MKLSKTIMAKTIKAITMAAIASVSMATFAADVAPTSPQLSVQLWSIKDDVAKDFEGTLKKLKAMGFQGVEFAGNFGAYDKDPKGLKTFLEKTGLKASGAHVHFDKLTPENFDATVAFYKAIDCKYLIIPMDSRAATAEGAKQVATELDVIQKKLAPHGMHTGYHNHTVEMLGDMGKTPWDVIGINTKSDVILQQDVGWTEVADMIVKGMEGAIAAKTVTYDFARLMDNPTEVKCSEFGDAIIKHMV